MIEAVVFDMDGVLFDSERLYTRAWRRVGAELGLADLEASMAWCVGRNGADIRSFLISKYGPDFDGADFDRRVTRAFRDIVDDEGLPIKPGVRALLDWLLRRGSGIALATSSGGPTAAHNLELSGLGHYFDVVITGDMIENGKPHPEIYQLACRRLGHAPGRCAALEDSPNGVRSAHAAGLKTIMVPDLIPPTAELERLLYAKFDSLEEALPFLAAEMADPE